MSLSKTRESSTFGIDVKQGNFSKVYTTIPQHIGILAQQNTTIVDDLAPFRPINADEVAKKCGYGSIAHLTFMDLKSNDEDDVGGIPITIYPLKDANAAVASSTEVTITGTVANVGLYEIYVNNIKAQNVQVETADTIADVLKKINTSINATVNAPVTSTTDDPTTPTKVTITAKMAGTIGNGFSLKIVPVVDSGLVIVTKAFTNGAGDPDVDSILNKMKDEWVTILVNTFPAENKDILTKIQLKNEARWMQKIRRFFVCINATVATDLNALKAITDVMKEERTNVIIQVPNSTTPVYSIAAQVAGKIAVVANADPAMEYVKLPLKKIIFEESDILDSEEREIAYKDGVSSVQVENRVLKIANIITTYRPDGDLKKVYKKVSTITRLQSIVYVLENRFNNTNWLGKILKENNKANKNENIRTPSMYKGELFQIFKFLDDSGIITEIDFAKDNTTVKIDSVNPDRIDAQFKLWLTGNILIQSQDLLFELYTGEN